MDKKDLARKKYRVMRGFSWLNIIIYLYTFISILSANVVLLQEHIKHIIFFDILYVYIFLWIIFPIFIIVLAYIIGYIDEHKGIWKNENDFQIELTPKLMSLFEDNKNIDDNK